MTVTSPASLRSRSVAGLASLGGPWSSQCISWREGAPAGGGELRLPVVRTPARSPLTIASPGRYIKHRPDQRRHGLELDAAVARSLQLPGGLEKIDIDLLPTTTALSFWSGYIMPPRDGLMLPAFSTK